MGNVVELHSQLEHLENNQEFIADCCRYAEAILSEAAVKKKYRFDDAVWAKLGDNDALVEAIEAEKIRRIRNGDTKRERAQQLVVQAPEVLGSIMLDASASPRHRINSAKALDDFAADEPQAGVPASEKFIITINLSADNAGGEPTILHFEKSIAVDPNDGDDSDPNGLIAAFTAKKLKRGGDGEPI